MAKNDANEINRFSDLEEASSMGPNQPTATEQANVPAPIPVKAAGELARRKIYAGIPDEDVALALALCQKYGFDPLLKHLVLIADTLKKEGTGQGAKRYNAYVTREGLLHIAHTSGLLDGLEATLGKDDLGEWAEAVIFRKDMSRPFRYRVYLSEYAREPRGAWKTHPRAMLTKTAEVFALRRAFDVALTSIEEIGFEEPVAGIPPEEASPEGTPSQIPGSETAVKTPLGANLVSEDSQVDHKPVPNLSERDWLREKPNLNQTNLNESSLSATQTLDNRKQRRRFF